MKHREEDRVLHHQGLILHVAVAAVVAEAAKEEDAVEAEVQEAEEAEVALPTTLLLQIPQRHQPQDDQ